ncbi:hypothetical protein POSPLADRAFT_1076531 [Postia placenta MAD-698-R-SB12]|uniref:OTU domain-containing protein n=1 Tax=Postia placenta MAD-698-R-SB12 TaxID=670580 RepID=A0A1X6MK72_9APHY|nr:hypothetical protein POSPLADRAFT_1076531 [Postia placenta MAD-698-R-SB12]OSX56646.1 hypothetical protein POSPLADRAFT_1076531 [Postia placenta MAD-698-R-SB12]
MGPSKRRNAKPVPQLRSRTTRSRGKALPDPAENTQQLTEQLRAMGLYAAATLGDGNCLFRALSDQLHGTPSYHLKLRQDICDWIASHKQRYEPFVDDERGLDVHLQCMRQPATYGGHLELSAFAHMTRRNVKVIQPGLVYVIEWAAGGDLAADVPTTPSAPSTSVAPDESNLNEREKRRAARDRKRAEKEKAPPVPPQPSEEDDPPGPVYVAYHDWEHFSSIRNLRGPHAGPPNVREVSAADVEPATPVVSKKPASKAKTKPESKTKASKHAALALAAESKIAAPVTPSQVPLPASRSPSPLSTARSTPFSTQPAHISSDVLAYRSPKRTFDESSASSLAASDSSQGAAKRAKSSSRAPSRTRTDETLPVAELPSSQRSDMPVDDLDLDTPDLSASGSSPESVSSLSSVPSPAATPPPTAPPERKLTRRQRKALGLPKARPAPVARVTARTRASAGKIVIPGGKFKKAAGKPAVQDTDGDEDDQEANAEWRHNGTGRVDVRGFRELKI